MKFKDYYEILGTAENATADEIKRAYRKKARRYHPDVCSEAGAEEKFKEVSEAYEALRDENRRAEYDQLKRHGFNNGDEFHGSPQWQRGQDFNPGGVGQSEFGDFFESIFGAGSFQQSGFQGARVARGDDLQLTVRVALENAYSGGKTKIQIPARPGSSARTLNVDIPAGVTNGKQLRLKSQGKPGINGGPPGDLVLTVKLKPHRIFEVEGRNVVLDLPLTPYEAAKGLVLPVPTLGGEVSMTIPAGVQSGNKMRLRSRGLPGTPPGDQIVTVQVVVPKVCSESALALLKQFDIESADNPRGHFSPVTTA